MMVVSIPLCAAAERLLLSLERRGITYSVSARDEETAVAFTSGERLVLLKRISRDSFVEDIETAIADAWEEISRW